MILLLVGLVDFLHGIESSLGLEVRLSLLVEARTKGITEVVVESVKEA